MNIVPTYDPSIGLHTPASRVVSHYLINFDYGGKHGLTQSSMEQ